MRYVVYKVALNCIFLQVSSVSLCHSWFLPPLLPICLAPSPEAFSSPDKADIVTTFILKLGALSLTWVGWSQSKDVIFFLSLISTITICREFYVMNIFTGYVKKSFFFPDIPVCFGQKIMKLGEMYFVVCIMSCWLLSRLIDNGKNVSDQLWLFLV